MDLDNVTNSIKLTPSSSLQSLNSLSTISTGSNDPLPLLGPNSLKAQRRNRERIKTSDLQVAGPLQGPGDGKTEELSENFSTPTVPCLSILDPSRSDNSCNPTIPDWSLLNISDSPPAADSGSPSIFDKATQTLPLSVEDGNPSSHPNHTHTGLTSVVLNDVSVYPVPTDQEIPLCSNHESTIAAYDQIEHNEDEICPESHQSMPKEYDHQPKDEGIESPVPNSFIEFLLQSCCGNCLDACKSCFYAIFSLEFLCDALLLFLLLAIPTLILLLGIYVSLLATFLIVFIGIPVFLIISLILLCYSELSGYYQEFQAAKIRPGQYRDELVLV